MIGSSHTVQKIGFRAANTRRNFGNDGSRKRGESNFLRAFEIAYFAKAGKGGIAAGEFSIGGYGIADLVWIAWTPAGARDGEFSAVSLEKSLRRRQLFAFEAKLKDWRRALKQAFRYRYFSDKAIVVMPHENSRKAVEHLDHFRRLGVGFWTFEKETGKIREHFTPTRIAAFNAEAKSKAVRLISSKVNFRKVGEKPEATL